MIGAIYLSSPLRCISKAFTDLYDMREDSDLEKAGLSLSDYWECKRLMPLLGAPGKTADTIYGKAADFFKEHGFKVTEQGVGFTITI